MRTMLVGMCATTAAALTACSTGTAEEVSSRPVALMADAQRLSFLAGVNQTASISVDPNVVCAIDGKGRPLSSDAAGHVSLHLQNPKSGTWTRTLVCSTPSGSVKSYPLEFTSSVGSDASPATPDPVDAPEGVIQPPLAGDPASYTQQQIVSFGYPPRPNQTKDPDGYSRWLKTVSTPVKRIQPTEIPIAGRHSNATSNIWSGVVLQGTPTYVSASGTLYVPSANDDEALANSDLSPLYASLWIGLDGGYPLYGSQANDVIQEGIDVQDLGDPFGIEYYAWTEWYPATFNQVSNFPVNYQDTIDAHVWIGDQYGLYDPAGGYAWFWMYNETRQTVFTTHMSAPAGAGFIGNTAEFIIERPAWQCVPWASCDWGIQPLTNFQSAIVSNVSAWSQYDEGPHNMANDIYTIYDMIDTAVPGVSTVATGNRIMVNGYDMFGSPDVVSWFWDYYW